MILTRRYAPLAAGALLAGALLTGCGFNEATNRVNQITNGTTDRDGTVDVINALVVASADDSGTLHAQLANNAEDDPYRLVEVGGEEVEVGDFEPLEVAPDGSTQLSEAGIRVDGDFAAGQYITLTLGFESADEAEEYEIEVPVVAACHEYEGLDDAPRTGGGQQGGDQEEYDCEAPDAPDGGH